MKLLKEWINNSDTLNGVQLILTENRKETFSIPGFMAFKKSLRERKLNKGYYRVHICGAEKQIWAWHYLGRTMPTHEQLTDGVEFYPGGVTFDITIEG